MIYNILIACLLLMCNAEVFYLKSVGTRHASSICQSMGLQYHAPLHANSSYHRCAGSGDDLAGLTYQAEVMGVKLVRPSIIKMSLKPVTNQKTLDTMSDAEKRERAWYVPIYPIKGTAYNANAYHVVADGYRGYGVELSVLGIAFATPSIDIPTFTNPYNAMDGSNNVYSNAEADYEHDSKVVSILTGKGDCVDGLSPDVTIRPIKVMNLDGMLQTDYLASASYLGVNDIQLRTFGPDNTMAHYDDVMMDDLVVPVMLSSMARGATYIVSGGNDGGRNNYTSARVCFDSSIAGFHGIISVGAFTPSGAVPTYVSRGCLFMSAPGGDEFHPMTLNDGFQCVASAGCSFAAPIVASLAVLLQELCNNTLTNSDLQDIFVRTSARDGLHDTHGIGGYRFLRNGANITYSDASGFGRVDFRAALQYVKDNKCPHVGAIAQCDTPVFTTDTDIAQVNRFAIPFPTDCNIKRVKYVRLSATFNVSLSSIVNWEVESPAAAIPCSLLPLQHPYMDNGKIYHTGCWSFYNETAFADAVWTIRYTTLVPSVSAAFGFNFFGFIV